MEHLCRQEKTIEDIRDTLYDKQFGMVKQVTEMGSDLKHLVNNTKDISSKIDDLSIFKNELTGAQREIDKSKNKIRWLIVILVTISLALVGIIIDIAIK